MRWSLLVGGAVGGVMFAGCACDVEVASTSPADGAVDVLPNLPLTATLSTLQDDVVVSVTDGAGNAVSGTTTVDGTTVTFTPDAPLAPSTTHTMTVTTCADTAVSFTTSDLGTPVDDADVLDATYVIDFDTAREVSPSGLPSLFGVIFADYWLAASFQAVSDDTSDILLGYVEGEDEHQDLCSPTIPIPTLSYANPWFALDVTDTVLHFAGRDVEVAVLTLSGAVSPDAQSLAEVYIHLVIDTRPLIGTMTDDPDAPEDYLCNVTSAVGVPCGACPSGDASTCIDLELRGVTAHRATAALVPWTEDDVATQTCE